uniref:hypothetical protein n=1 Tax=Agathobacter sp. TaxID=2021311 RepID=UPI004055A016
MTCGINVIELPLHILEDDAPVNVDEWKFLDKSYNAVLLTYGFAADSALAQIQGKADYIATVPYRKV